MDRGRMLGEASNVLVQIAGGPGMTFSEVEIMMRELGKHVNDHAQIFFGTAVDGRMGERMSVTVISSVATEDDLLVQPQLAPVAVEVQPVAVKPEPIEEPAPLVEPAAIEDVAPA